MSDANDLRRGDCDYDYSQVTTQQLARELNMLHCGLTRAIHLGEMLFELKQRIGYGNWAAWVEKHLTMSLSVAGTCMLCFLYREQCKEAVTVQQALKLLRRQNRGEVPVELKRIRAFKRAQGAAAARARGRQDKAVKRFLHVMVACGELAKFMRRRNQTNNDKLTREGNSNAINNTTM